MGSQYAYREAGGTVHRRCARAFRRSSARSRSSSWCRRGIAGGVWSADARGRWLDRTISIAGLSATVMPEFASSPIVLDLSYSACGRAGCPSKRRIRLTPARSNNLRYLILPVPAARCLRVLRLHRADGARRHRRSARRRLHAHRDILKGLPRHTVIWRHVLRNALLPTITVAATQPGYMIGGLVAGRDAIPLSGHRLADLQRREGQRLSHARSRRADGLRRGRTPPPT